MSPLLASDPALQDEARELIRETFRVYRLQLKTGDAPTKLALLRGTVPAIFRSAAAAGADDGVAELRTAFAAMREEVRVGLTPVRAPAGPKPIKAVADKPKKAPAVRVTRPKRAGSS